MCPSAFKDNRGGHNAKQVNQLFFQTWTPQMAYVLGFIFADGAIEDVQKSSRTCYLAFTLSKKDLNLLEQIKKIIGSNHNIYLRKAMFNIFPGGKKYLSGEEVILRIGSKLIYNDLLKLGVTPRKSLTIKFPNVPIEFLSYFIRGYFDGDGCLYLIKAKYPRVVFTSGSFKFLTGLARSLSQGLGIPLKQIYISHSGSNPCYRLQYSTSSALKILEFMYKDLNQAPYLERKYLKYKSLNY